MSEVVEGKNIMITGATSGIGLELVKSFSSKGANIIMLGKDEDKLDASSLSSSFPSIIILAPFDENDFTSSRPIPLVAPVIIIFFPSTTSDISFNKI